MTPESQSAEAWAKRIVTQWLEDGGQVRHLDEAVADTCRGYAAQECAALICRMHGPEWNVKGCHVCFAIQEWDKKFCELANENEALQAALTEARKEIHTNDMLLLERNRLLDSLPPCPIHGAGCVPFAMEEVGRLQLPVEAALENTLDRLERILTVASEERYRGLQNWEAEAGKWKAQGDMYGWNFHMGMAAGANWCDIFYQRIGREIETIRKEQAALRGGETNDG